MLPMLRICRCCKSADLPRGLTLVGTRWQVAAGVVLKEAKGLQVEAWGGEGARRGARSRRAVKNAIRCTAAARGATREVSPVPPVTRRLFWARGGGSACC